MRPHPGVRLVRGRMVLRLAPARAALLATAGSAFKVGVVNL